MEFYSFLLHSLSYIVVYQFNNNWKSKKPSIMFIIKETNINLKNRHGEFATEKDIQKIKPISPELFRKIAPYFKTYD